MGSFRFSRRADDDLFGIGIYTLRKWGEAQTDRYISALEECCRLLGDNPGLGRPCDQIRPGLHRMEHGQHVVFYRVEEGGILVCRVLHGRMQPESRAIDDEDEG